MRSASFATDEAMKSKLRLVQKSVYDKNVMEIQLINHDNCAIAQSVMRHGAYERSPVIIENALLTQGQHESDRHGNEIAGFA